MTDALSREAVPGKTSGPTYTRPPEHTLPDHPERESCSLSCGLVGTMGVCGLALVWEAGAKIQEDGERRLRRGGEVRAQREVQGSGSETGAPVATSHLGFWDAPQNNMDPGALGETGFTQCTFPGGVTALSS